MELSQQQKLKQELRLTPQMLQSIAVLQMGAQELLSHVEEQLLENPVLELEESTSNMREEMRLQRTREWLTRSSDYQNRYYYGDEDTDPLRNLGDEDFSEGDFCHFVESQILTQDLPPELAEACHVLIYSLNDNGWLDTPLELISTDLGLPLPLLEQALTIIQGLEPHGVGARDLKECLLLQLHQLGEDDEITCAIVTNHLEALSKNHFNQIAQTLHADREAVEDSVARIRALSPRPSAGFSNRNRLAHITPDVVVVQFQDYFEILLNDSYLPRLRSNDYYTKLLEQTQDEEVRRYLSEKTKDAKQLIGGVRSRGETVLLCARMIVQKQEAFFRNGPGHLHPLTMDTLAQELEVHESTVSRALKDKFLQCSYGVFPLSYFFSRSLGSSGEISADGARALLRRIIEAEDKHAPLSDQKISEAMALEGMEISRRTVAKYRDAMHIPPASQRRQAKDK